MLRCFLASRSTCSTAFLPALVRICTAACEQNPPSLDANACRTRFCVVCVLHSCARFLGRVSPVLGVTDAAWRCRPVSWQWPPPTRTACFPAFAALSEIHLVPLAAGIPVGRWTRRLLGFWCTSRQTSALPHWSAFVQQKKKNRFQATPQITQNLTVFCLQ